MGGCVACYRKPGPDTTLNKPSRGVRVRAVKKPSRSEDFWSTSTFDMDNSTFPSQGSVSSFSTSNQIFDSQGGAGSSNVPSEFVNHGFLLWNQTRQCWVGKKRSDNHLHHNLEPKLNWNATYDSLLGSNKPFPQPVPLSYMCFLVAADHGRGHSLRSCLRTRLWSIPSIALENIPNRRERPQQQNNCDQQ